MNIQEYKQMLETEHKTKYGNRKTIVDGFMFDSQLEANYYSELKLRERVSEVAKIILQPVFLLQDAFLDGKARKTIRAINYVADFRFMEYQKYSHNWLDVVVDCKGFQTKVYKLKIKLFKAKYPKIDFREIF